jgi:hypothetical protein
MRLRSRRNITFSGEYCQIKETAWINLDNPSRIVISTFFHELGHHLDYKSGKFRAFYDLRYSLAAQRRVALRAERHADFVGQKLCKKFFPKVKYDKSYVKQEDIDWLLNEYLR